LAGPKERSIIYKPQAATQTTLQAATQTTLQAALFFHYFSIIFPLFFHYSLLRFLLSASLYNIANKEIKTIYKRCKDYSLDC
jgi:hypothetical protein